MIVTSFAVRPSAFMRIRATETGPRLVGMAEGTILHAMLMDISKRIKPEGEDLLIRLHRSGWIYKSLAEFYARRMYSAFLYMALAVGISFTLELLIGASMVPLGSALLGTLGAVYGFSLPDRLVNRAIQRRRYRLLKEMGFGLDRIKILGRIKMIMKIDNSHASSSFFHVFLSINNRRAILIKQEKVQIRFLSC